MEEIQMILDKKQLDLKDGIKRMDYNKWYRRI